MNKILILAANPKDTSRLRLDEELREIEEGLLRAKKRDQFVLKTALAVRHRDIHRQILDFEPQIVHFSGHGEGENGLLFEDVMGQIKLVDAVALADLFELFAEHVKCVLLNACYSEIQAKAIAQHIDYVIGMNQAIGDKAAIEFAVGFYDALGAGKNVEFAYKLGCRVIRMAGSSEHITPVLLTKNQSGSEEVTTINAQSLINKYPNANYADASPSEIDNLFDISNKLSAKLFSFNREQFVKAKQLEAKTYISSINKGQQAFYIEWSKFATTLEELELSIKSETENYKYEMIVFNHTKVVTIATAKIDGLKSYTGVVFLINNEDYQTTIVTVCETVSPSKIAPDMPILVGSNIQYAPGSVNVSNH